MVRGSWIKPGAVIIDVGINPVEVCIDVTLFELLFFRPCYVYLLYLLLVSSFILKALDLWCVIFCLTFMRCGESTSV